MQYKNLAKIKVGRNSQNIIEIKSKMTFTDIGF